MSKDPVFSKRTAESYWGCKILTDLCLDIGLDPQKPSDTTSFLKKNVLDYIAKSLRESMSQSYTSTDDRYNRYLALSELVLHMVSHKPTISDGFPRSRQNTDENSVQTARLMLEKGIVQLLTDIISDIDVHHPSSKRLLSRLLKPLEILTKVAIKVSKTPAGENESPEKGKDTSATQDSTLRPGVEPEDGGELSSIYRNSALSMFGPRTDNEDMEYSSDDEDGFDFSDDSLMDDDDDDTDEVHQFSVDLLNSLFYGVKLKKNILGI
jgi:E3 ubiquitin-protein ligase HUWE1